MEGEGDRNWKGCSCIPRAARDWAGRARPPPHRGRGRHRLVPRAHPSSWSASTVSSFSTASCDSTSAIRPSLTSAGRRGARFLALLSPHPHRPCIHQTARRPLLLVCPRWGAAGRRTAGGIIPVVAWVFGGWSRPAISRDAIAAERGRNVEPAPSWGYGRCIACRVGGLHWEPLLGGSVGRGSSAGHPPAVRAGRRAGRRRPSPRFALRKSFSCLFERRFVLWIYLLFRFLSL